MINLLFLSYLEVTLTISAIILLLKLFSFYLAKKYSPQLKYWIWFILGLLLIIPLRYHFPQAKVIYIPVQSAVIEEHRESNIDTDQTELNSTLMFNNDANTENQANLLSGFNILSIVSTIWIIGAALFLAYHLLCYFKLRHSLMRRSKRLENQNIYDNLQQTKVELGITKQIITIYGSKQLSPMMIGFVHPRLYLPFAEYSDTQLHYIIKHEMVHLKRRDIWYKLFLLIVNAVHWYNPVIHLMFREACKDLEMSCDNIVVRKFTKAQRIEYCDTIISSAKSYSRKQFALASNFKGDKKILKERLLNIASNKKKNGYFIVACLLVVILTMSGFVAYTSKTAQLEPVKVSDAATTTKAKSSPLSATQPDTPISQIEAQPTTPISIKTVDNLSMTDEEFAVQRAEMREWLDNLDNSNYAGLGYRNTTVKSETGEEILLNDMIIYMMDINKFDKSEKMQEAKNNGWHFCVETGVRSINDLDVAAKKLFESKDRFNIENIDRKHTVDFTDNVLYVYTGDNSEKNLAAMEQYVGIIGIQLPNLYITDPEDNKSYIGYYKQAGLENDSSVFFGRPNVYRVNYRSANQPVNQRSGFILQYDSPKSDDEINQIIKQRISENIDDSLEYTFEYQKLDLEPAE